MKTNRIRYDDFAKYEQANRAKLLVFKNKQNELTAEVQQYLIR